MANTDSGSNESDSGNPGTDGGGTVHGATAVFVSGASSLAINPAGGVLQWGTGFGMNPTFITTATATPFWKSGIVSLADGAVGAACALTNKGGVECVGYNGFGVLGNGSNAQESATPVPVTGLASGVAAISGQDSTMCALTSGGAVLCWGDNNKRELGAGSTGFSSSTPVNVGIASGAAALAMGGTHGCAMMNNGDIQCWGANLYGEVGVASPTTVITPVVVSGLPASSKVVAGREHTCILTKAGGVMCWGNNASGQLGRAGSGATPDYATGLSSGVIDIGAGGNETCATLTGGGVKCWGASAFSNGSPTDINGLSGAVDGLAVMDNHACFHIGTSVQCIGYNDDGQCGDGSGMDAFNAVDVSGL